MNMHTRFAYAAVTVPRKNNSPTEQASIFCLRSERKCKNATRWSVRHSNYRQSKEKNQHTDARKPIRGVWRRTSRRKAGGARGEKRPGRQAARVGRRGRGMG
jgi:hypothetical protein